MAIAKMKFVRVYGPVEKIDEFISVCCLTGQFHPENALEYMSSSLDFTTLSGENPYSARIRRIEELANVAGTELDDSVDISNHVPTELDEEKIDAMMEKMRSFHSLHKELTDEIAHCDSEQEHYSHFRSLTVPIKDLVEGRFFRFRFGSMPKEYADKIENSTPGVPFIFVPCDRTQKSVWALYLTPRENAEKIDRVFASYYFDRIHIESEAGTPAEVLEVIERERNLLVEALKKLDGEIADYWNEMHVKVNALYTYLKRQSAAFELRRFASTDRKGINFNFVGWVTAESEEEFVNAATGIEGVSCEVSTPEENANAKPPVKLKNHLPFRPFEMFVSMYGLPSYGGVDITPFVAITYSILFGIMFADFGQGLLLTIGALVLSKTKGYGIAKIMVPCGCCSMIFGFLFGSVFGFEHILDPVFQKVFGLPGKPIDVMDSVNGVLLMAITIGIVLVALAMLMNIFIRLRGKEFGEAFFSENGVAGLVLYSALVSCIVKFMGSITVIPTPVCIAMIVISLPLLFCKELLIDRIDKKGDGKVESIADFVMQNFFEVIEYILSYFSNTVSFLRIGAFVLVHSGMMMVFFSLAGSPESPADVSIGGWFAIALGNVFVMALEGLLTGIQSLRLEYYEMFSRFYDGDGRSFTGVGSPQKNTMIKKIKRLAGRHLKSSQS